MGLSIYVTMLWVTTPQSLIRGLIMIVLERKDLCVWLYFEVIFHLLEGTDVRCVTWTCECDTEDRW